LSDAHACSHPHTPALTLLLTPARRAPTAPPRARIRDTLRPRHRKKQRPRSDSGPSTSQQFSLPERAKPSPVSRCSHCSPLGENAPYSGLGPSEIERGISVIQLVAEALLAESAIRQGCRRGGASRRRVAQARRTNEPQRIIPVLELQVEHALPDGARLPRDLLERTVEDIRARGRFRASQNTRQPNGSTTSSRFSSSGLGWPLPWTSGGRCC
jgi:hypothetical protein